MRKCKDTLKKKVRNWVKNGSKIKMLMHIIYFGCSLFFMNVCIGGEHIAHLVQSNKPMYKQMEFYFKNQVPLSCDLVRWFLVVPPKEKFVDLIFPTYHCTTLITQLLLPTIKPYLPTSYFPPTIVQPYLPTYRYLPTYYFPPTIIKPCLLTSYFPPTIVQPYLPTSYFPPTISHLYLHIDSHVPPYLPTYRYL